MKFTIRALIGIGTFAAFFGTFAALPALAQFPIRIPRVTTQPTPRPTDTQTNPQTTTQQSQRGGANQEALRREFSNEFWSKRQSIYNLMQVHDPNLKVGNTSYGPPTTRAEWESTMKDLAEIDAACKSKYAGMTDDPRRLQIGELNNLPATWCTIAANRVEYEKKGKLESVSSQARHTTDQIKQQLDTLENEPEERIILPMQDLFWDTEKWKAETFKKLKPAFDQMEITIPDDYLAEYITRAYSLRDRRIKSGESRSFEQPPHRDAAIETWVRTQYQQQFPGIKVLKIGSSYTDWRVSTNRVGVPTSRSKRGWALVQLPNRPLCQAREWIVRQDYAGGGRYTANKVDSLGVSGILTKCQ